MRKPRYIELCNTFRGLIQTGEYKYGDSFPPERELEVTYGMDRKTIRKALNVLVDEGLLIRIQGKGTFVNNPKIDYSMKKNVGFRHLLEQQGISNTTKTISITKEQAGYRVSKALGVDRSSLVYKIVKQRLAEGEPLAYETTYVRDGLFSGIEDIDFDVYSLYEYYTQHGHKPVQVKEWIDAVEVINPEAKYLGVEEGETVFLVTNITKDADGTVIEFTRSYTNSSRINLSTQLS